MPSHIWRTEWVFFCTARCDYKNKLFINNKIIIKFIIFNTHTVHQAIIVKIVLACGWGGRTLFGSSHFRTSRENLLGPKFCRIKSGDNRFPVKRPAGKAGLCSKTRACLFEFDVGVAAVCAELGHSSVLLSFVTNVTQSICKKSFTDLDRC